MYEHNANQLSFSDEFFLPFEGRLNPDNRWVIMASLMPWSDIESKYIKRLKDTSQGKRAYPARLALGSLIIQNKLGLSDEETVLAITENPYLQYFIGLHTFQTDKPFDASSMTHFRKRFDIDFINEINESIVKDQSDTVSKSDSQNDDDDKPPGGTSNKSDVQNEMEKPNKGKLLLDATCAPANIAYPTDFSLLNEAREKTEGIIDALHKPLIGKERKPRTYRQKARKQYLSLSKQRRPGMSKIRKGIRQQLGYVQRNLKHIEKLGSKVGLRELNPKQYKDLLVIQELYRQQETMFKQKSNSIKDRIVSISQPHVRPIVRGKANAPVEFGAKLTMSLVNGYSFLDILSWDPYHEGKFLHVSLEKYKEKHGYYPEAVLADAIYRTRENRQYCKSLGIRMSGPRLGRPPEDEQKNALQKQQEQQDASERNQIEGKFGEGKRKYGLGLISACLQKTSETSISLGLLVMNLSKLLREVPFLLFYLFTNNLVKRKHYTFIKPYGFMLVIRVIQ